MSTVKQYVCDECGTWDSLAATTTVRQNDKGDWVITGDINIDWCDRCGSDKPRCTLRAINLDNEEVTC